MCWLHFLLRAYHIGECAHQHLVNFTLAAVSGHFPLVFGQSKYRKRAKEIPLQNIGVSKLSNVDLQIKHI